MAENRKNFLNATKYQKRIVMIPFIGTFVLCLFITVVLNYFNKDLVNYILRGSDLPNMRVINSWTIFLIFNVWLFFFFIMVWAFVASSNLVGAFERIIQELDKFLEGNKKGPIFVRKDDDLAIELLKRVNKIMSYRKES